jgi:transcriptional regulator with XRE-family HTH domain
VPAPGKSSPKTLHHRETPRFRRLARVLARRLRDLRTGRGWTIEQAAERMEVEPAHVGRMESGAANPSLAVLASVAHAFGLTVSELLRPEPR